MSCLPLFSFGHSITAAMRPFSDLADSEPTEQCFSTRSVAPKLPNAPESLYDKLSRVSVSHRRVDSFEWVITQSAPNTPLSSNDTGFKPFSPPSKRLVHSAPLPVPHEHWSLRANTTQGQQQRGYFNWWSSPSLSNSKGYAMIPDVEQHHGEGVSSTRNCAMGSPKTCVNEADAKKELRPRSRAASFCPRDCDKSVPSKKLNALGIVLPDTPPPSPPMSDVSDMPHPYTIDTHTTWTTSRRLPKRVTFSPVVNEVIPEFSSDLNEQQPSLWGSYLPSSFIVARPPLPRTASLPANKAQTCVRPILRHSTVSETLPTRTTEMIQLSPSMGSRLTRTTESSLPVQRLPVSQLTVSGTPGGNLGDAERSFASLMQATHQASRRQCDPVLS